MSSAREKELYKSVSIPFLEKGNALLVPIGEAKNAGIRLMNQGKMLLGWDAFILHEDGRLQGSMENGIDYSGSRPSLFHGIAANPENFEKHIDAIDSSITHVEFCWDLL